MYRMNQASEWEKVFEERVGRYRYKHEGSGVVRDSLATIGKIFQKKATQAVKKTAKRGAEKQTEKVVERGSK